MAQDCFLSSLRSLCWSPWASQHKHLRPRNTTPGQMYERKTERAKRTAGHHPDLIPNLKSMPEFFSPFAFSSVFGLMRVSSFNFLFFLA